MKNLPFDFNKYKKSLKRIYRVLNKYRGMGVNDDKAKTALIACVVKDLYDELGCNKIVATNVLERNLLWYVFSESTIIENTISLATTFLGDLNQTYTGVGRLLQLKTKEDLLEATISPLFADSPFTQITVEEPYHQGLRNWRTRSGIPKSLASIVHPEHLEGILVAYVHDGIRRKTKLVSGTYKPLIPWNNKIVYSKIGRNTRGVYRCHFCGTQHNGRYESWCTQIKNITENEAESFKVFAGIKGEPQCFSSESQGDRVLRTTHLEGMWHILE